MTEVALLKKICVECGQGFGAHPRFAQHAEFCSTKCRREHNNRRMTRGAVVFDLLMAARYERKLANRLKLWRQLCRLAMDFRREDHAERNSRKSWRDPRTVLAERPYLNAIVVADKTWRRVGP